ncbi:hypothetical protein Tco_0711365 [Tanacetum coccineum]
MTKPTMEEYVTKARGDYYSGITKIMINGKAAYELKGKFLDDLRNNAFSGTNGEDVVEHIENFLKIVDPLDLPNKKGDDQEILSDLEEAYAVDEDEDTMQINFGALKIFEALCRRSPCTPLKTALMMMDPFTKNALWDYWKKGDDQEVLLIRRGNDEKAIREEGKPNDHGIRNLDIDLGSKKYKTSETTSGSAQGGFNLNDEAGGSEEEIREERPIGRDRAKKKASSSSSRSATSSVAGGGLVDLVADKWKSIKLASRGKKNEQQDSCIQLKNRESDIQDATRREAAEL